MQGTVVVARPAARDATSQLRSLFTIALLIFASTLIVVRQTQHDTQLTVLKGKMGALEGNVGTEPLDPDAPHMRVSNSHLYVPQDDPDAPNGNVESQQPHGMRLEFHMQHILEHMATGTEKSPKSGVSPRKLYTPSEDPDAPSTNDKEQLHTDFLGKIMNARLRIEQKMDRDLKLKANALELEPKYMPSNAENSMMLDLKYSKQAHLFKDEDEQKLRNEAEATKRKRELQRSWLKYNWAKNGPPKKPGFRSRARACTHTYTHTHTLHLRLRTLRTCSPLITHLISTPL
jgi:hypothetical protein